MTDARRILVVEDAKDSRLLIGCFLDSPIYRLDMAENGEQALELFKQQAYDLVLMDMQMPIMDGYEATRQIRKWEARQGRPLVPILAASAVESPEEIERCLEAGCTDHVGKPFRKQQLLAALARHLSN